MAITGSHYFERQDPASLDQSTPDFAEPRLRHYFSQLNVRASGQLQAKLEVSRPGDPYEQEADSIADQVMRTEQPSGNGILPRKHAEREEEQQGIQSKETQSVSAVPSAVAAAGGPGGQPLDPATRAFMEPRFGFDFSQVRIHADAESAEVARSVSARAFTVGADIVFGAGLYTPDTSARQRLIAHELTHVEQQARQERQTHDA